MKKSTLLLFALLFLVVQESQSAPILLTFNGTVTSLFTDPIDPFAGTIDVGTAMSGFARYDSTTADAIPSADVGSYSMFSSPPLGMTISIGGNTFSASDFLNISVANNIGTGVDQLTILAQQGVQGGLTDYLSMQLFLEDPTSTVFNSDGLPISQPNMGNFLVRNFFIDGVQTINGEAVQFQIQGNVSVPEANSIFLLGIGLVSFCFIRHRQMRYALEI